MTTEPESHREWFTPVWVVPLLLIFMIVAYAAINTQTAAP
jgi:hypothetical protein